MVSLCQRKRRKAQELTIVDNINVNKFEDKEGGKFWQNRDLEFS